MTTYTNNSGTGTHSATNAVPYLLDEIVDFANLETTADVAITPGSADVYTVLNIPALSTVVMAGIEVLTVESTNTTTKVALGDGSVVYVAAAVVTSLGNMTGVNDIAEVGVGYTAADTLDLTSSVAAPTDAKLRVWAIVQDMSSPNVTQRQKFT